MSVQADIIKELQLKDQSKPILIINPPKEYGEVLKAFEAKVHKELGLDSYPFVRVYGTSN